MVAQSLGGFDLGVGICYIGDDHRALWHAQRVLRIILFHKRIDKYCSFPYAMLGLFIVTTWYAHQKAV